MTSYQNVPINKKMQAVNRARAIAEGTIPMLFGRKTEQILMYLLYNKLYENATARYSSIAQETNIKKGNSLNYNLELLKRNGFVQESNYGKRGYKLTDAGFIVARNLLSLIRETMRKLDSGEITIIDSDSRQIAIEELSEIAAELDEMQARLNLIPTVTD